MDWRARLTQTQVCETLMNNGHAFAWLEKAMESTTEEDHLNPLDRYAYLHYFPLLDNSLVWNTNTALELHQCLKESGRVITYQKKEVGALIRFPHGTVGNEQGMAFVDYLLKLPSLMTLNDAQITELEYLLNKAGGTLGVPLPVIPSATAEEQEAMVRAVALFALQTKPKAYYQMYLDELKAKGTPATMTQKEFSEFAEQLLTDPNGYTL